jgi:hypothetical protein
MRSLQYHTSSCQPCFCCGTYTVKTVLLHAKQAQWGSICIDLSIRHPGTRRGWVVSSIPWPLEPREWEPVPIVHLQHTLYIDPVTGFLIIWLYFRTTHSILSTESIFKKNAGEWAGSYFLILWYHKVRNYGTVNTYATRLRAYGLNGKLSKSMAQDTYRKLDKPLTKYAIKIL